MGATQEDMNSREPLMYQWLRKVGLDKEPPKVEVERLYDISQIAMQRCPVRPSVVDLNTWGYKREDYLESSMLSDSDWMMKTVATDQLTSFYEEWDEEEDGGLRRNFMQSAVDFVFAIRNFANPTQVEAQEVMQGMRTKVQEMESKYASVNLDDRLTLGPEEIIMLTVLAFPERLAGKHGEEAFLFLEALHQGDGGITTSLAKPASYNLSIMEKRLNTRVAEMASNIFGSRKSLRKIMQRDPMESPVPKVMPEPIVPGEKLPGLINGPDMSEGKYYWDQVIKSPFGNLSYDPMIQRRDGFIRWTSEDGRTVTVESRTGIVRDISEPISKE